MSVLNRFDRYDRDFYFFWKMSSIHNAKVKTIYNENMKEIIFNYGESIMPYEGKSAHGDVYYQYSRFKYENPNKVLYLFLCVKFKETLEKLCLEKLFFPLNEAETCFLRRINDAFKYISNFTDIILNKYGEQEKSFFIYFQRYDYLNEPTFDKLYDIVSRLHERDSESDSSDNSEDEIEEDIEEQGARQELEEINRRERETRDEEILSNFMQLIRRRYGTNARVEFDALGFYLVNLINNNGDVVRLVYSRDRDGIEAFITSEEDRLLLNEVNRIRNEQELLEIEEIHQLTEIDNNQQSQPQHINSSETFKSDSCVICNTTAPTILFCSCGHICICNSCNDLYQKKECPVCRVKSEIKRKI